MKDAIPVALAKLRTYYSRTSNAGGLLYNLGTILNPQIKLSMYSSDEWGFNYFEEYRKDFLRYYKEHYERREKPGEACKRFEQIHDPLRRKLQFVSSDEELFSLLAYDADYIEEVDRFSALHSGEDRTQNEAALYIREKTVERKYLPLEWWKLYSHHFPVLSEMAKDILAIPIASVDVERCFSKARDILPYRRNRLAAGTIRGTCYATCGLTIILLT